MSKKIAGYPCWLTLSEDRTSFSLDPARAATIRRIFEMSRDGLGCYTIAKQLNEQNVASFGTSGRWEQSTIDKMLRSRSVLGEHRPTGPVGPTRAAAYRTEEVILGFYPAAIDEELFNAVQRAREENSRTRRGRRGSLITNLFGRRITCLHCWAPVRLHRGEADQRSMVCSTVLDGGHCHRFGWSYPDFEAAVLETVLESPVAQVAGSPLVEAIRALPTADPYLGRQEVEKQLRKSINFIGMAAGGHKPEPRKPDAIIKRNKPGRYLEIGLQNWPERYRSNEFG